MRTTTALACLGALVAAAPAALAQLSTFRGTIPGSLHQCEQTTVFFFNSGNESPKTLIFLPQGEGPSGTTTQSAIEALGPLQVIDGITTPDAQSYGFTLQIAAGVKFDTYGFLPDGSGKNLNLPRSVQTPLPGASQCNPASTGAVAAAQTTAVQATATGGASSPTMKTSARAQQTDTSNSSGSSAAPSGATQTAAMGTPLSRSAPSSTSSSSSSNTAGATPASAAAATSGNTTSGAGAGKAVGVGAAFVAVGAAVVAAL